MNKPALRDLKTKVAERNAVSAQDVIALIEALAPDLAESEDDTADETAVETKKPTHRHKGDK